MKLFTVIFSISILTSVTNCSSQEEAKVSAGVSDAESDVCFVDSLTPSFGLTADTGFKCKSRQKMADVMQGLGYVFSASALGCYYFPEPGFSKVAGIGFSALGLTTGAFGLYLKNIPCTDPPKSEAEFDMIAEAACIKLQEVGGKCEPNYKYSFVAPGTLTLKDLSQPVSIGGIEPKLPSTSVNGFISKSSPEIEKIAWNDVMGDELVRIRYRIDFEFAGSHNNAGKFLNNIKLVPITVEVKPPVALESVKWSIQTEQPLNIGGIGYPKFEFAFKVTWDLTALDIGDQEKTRTDSFKILSASGEFKSDVQNFLCTGLFCI